MSTIKHIKIPIKDIILLDKNPRTISDEDLDKLCQDIKKDISFLVQRPPLINKVKDKYYCYAGTQRVKACQKLGYDTIKCFVEENVPDKLQDERMLKDNLHRGQWDQEKLLDLDFEIMELKEIGLDDFNLTFVEDGDFSGRNKEINQDDLDGEMIIKLKYNETDYHSVLGGLSKVATTPSEAVKKLLKIE